MEMILKIKFKMSAMLTNVIKFQDKGGSVESLDLTVPIFTYSDILEDLQYMDNMKLSQLYDLLLDDDQIIKNRLEGIYEK